MGRKPSGRGLGRPRVGPTGDAERDRLRENARRRKRRQLERKAGVTENYQTPPTIRLARRPNHGQWSCGHFVPHENSDVPTSVELGTILEGIDLYSEQYEATLREQKEQQQQLLPPLAVEEQHNGPSPSTFEEGILTLGDHEYLPPETHLADTVSSSQDPAEADSTVPGITTSRSDHDLTDREAAIDTMVRLLLSLDNGDSDSCASCLGEEVNLDIPSLRGIGLNDSNKTILHGKTAVAEHLMNTAGETLDTTHYATNIRCTVDGDMATFTCYVLAQHFRLGESLSQAEDKDYFTSGSRYSAEMSRDDDGSWKVNKLAVNLSWVLGNPEVMVIC